MLKPIQTEDSKQLPELAYRVLFEQQKVFYKGSLLRVGIVKNRRFPADRAIRVGDYLYSEQSKVGESLDAQSARAGKKIMWIIQASSGEIIARVEDGAVERLNK